jgi:hypothetical protein
MLSVTRPNGSGKVDVGLRKSRWSTSFMEPSMADSTGLYKEFSAECQEILCHKWIESEKAGRDIGFEHALLDWTLK